MDRNPLFDNSYRRLFGDWVNTCMRLISHFPKPAAQQS